MVGVVIGSIPFGSKVVARKVIQLTANLHTGQIEEVLDGLNPYILQGSVKPNHGILENVIGGFPAAEIGVVPESPAGDA